MQKILERKEININEKFYPRFNTDWRLSHQYSQAMKTGAKFPLIEVAKIKNKYYLIDGRHRLEALSRNKKKHIQVNVNKSIDNFNDLYVLSIKRNSQHGRRFTTYEMSNILIKLKDMRLAEEAISQLIHIPIKNLDKFMAHHITNTISGKQIALKSSVKHLSKEIVTDDFDQENIGSNPQIAVLHQFINMLEDNLFNLKNKMIYNKLVEIKQLLKRIK